MEIESEVGMESEIYKKSEMSSLHVVRKKKQTSWKDLHTEYTETERRIHKACDQMTAIYSKIQDMQVRLDRARGRSQFGFTYSLEMQLQVVQGVYDKYYLYCSVKAERLLQLESLLFAGEE